MHRRRHRLDPGCLPGPPVAATMSSSRPATPPANPPVYNENCNGDLPACTGGIYSFGPGGNTNWTRNLPNVLRRRRRSPPDLRLADDRQHRNRDPRDRRRRDQPSLYALNPSSGATEPGWPQQTADTTFATAAIANIDGNQHIIAASDSTAGAFNNWNGGSVRSMNANGTTNWTAASNEVVTSSPVVANLGSGPGRDLRARPLLERQ